MAENDKASPPATGRGLKGVSSGDEHLQHRTKSDADQPLGPDRGSDGVPFMITRGMKAELAKLGYSPEEIAELRRIAGRIEREQDQEALERLLVELLEFLNRVLGPFRKHN